ncbi:MAG: hypothetical protein R6V49_00905 [Bacteroidales bacterium]
MSEGTKMITHIFSWYETRITIHHEGAGISLERVFDALLKADACGMEMTR